ncbi:MAG: HAD family hydrolase [Candidatus Asgardarchaeia archaeon]
MCRIAIFDMDGTLLTLPIDYPSLKKELNELLGREIESIMETLRELDKSNDPRLYDAFKILDKYELEAAEKLIIYDDTYRTLSWFRENNYALGLVTLQGFPVVEKIINRYFEGFFNGVITRETSLYRRDQILKLLRLFSCNYPEKVIFVGDSYTDILAYRELKCRFYLIRRYKKKRNFVFYLKEKALMKLYKVNVVKSLDEVIKQVSSYDPFKNKIKN